MTEIWRVTIARRSRAVGIPGECLEIMDWKMSARTDIMIG